MKPKKVRFCPKCNSVNVGVKITVTAALGIPQTWECRDCGLNGFLFPEKEIQELEKIKEKNTK